MVPPLPEKTERVHATETTSVHGAEENHENEEIHELQDVDEDDAKPVKEGVPDNTLAKDSKSALQENNNESLTSRIVKMLRSIFGRA